MTLGVFHFVYLDLDRVYCVDDWGRHYENIEAIFNDPGRLKKFENYYFSQRDTIYGLPDPDVRVTGIIDASREYELFFPLPWLDKVYDFY